jgi:hypothetical protein
MFGAPLSALALCLIAIQIPRLAWAEPGKAAPCHLSKIAELPITVTPGNAVLVDGSIKDQPVRFQIDTGAELTTFDNAVFSRFGVANAGQELRMMGVGGESTAVRTKIPDLKIGNFDGGSMMLTVSATHFMGNGIYALLGQDFFGMFDLDIDLAKGRIGLFENNPCPTEPVYWATSFSEADLSVRPNRILVSIEINGTPARAIFDTGASTTLLSTTLVQRLGLNVNSPGMEKLDQGGRGIDMHSLAVYRYRFAELRIGDEVIKNPVLKVANLTPIKHNSALLDRLQDSNAPDTDAILGADFVKSHHIYIAPKDRKMYFTYNGGGIFSPPKDESAAAGSPQ